MTITEPASLVFRFARALHLARVMSRESRARGRSGCASCRRKHRAGRGGGSVSRRRGLAAAGIKRLCSSVSRRRVELARRRAPAPPRRRACSRSRRAARSSPVDLEGELDREGGPRAGGGTAASMNCAPTHSARLAWPSSRRGAGDEALPPLEQALEIALAASSPHAVVLAQQPRLAGDVHGRLPARGRALGGRLGARERDSGSRRWTDSRQGVRTFILFDTGRWGEALALAEAFIAESEAGLTQLPRGRSAEHEGCHSTRARRHAGRHRGLPSGRSIRSRGRGPAGGLSRVLASVTRVLRPARPVRRSTPDRRRDAPYCPRAPERGGRPRLRRLRGRRPRTRTGTARDCET